MHIIIIEQHQLVRLGLASLMACLVSSDRIKTQSHEDLYRSPPHMGPANLVLLSAHPEDRISLLIQAVRRAHAPKRILLLSENVTCPASWGTLPPLVAGYLSTRSSAEVILAATQSLIHKFAAHRAAQAETAATPASISAGTAPSSSYPPTPQNKNPVNIGFEIDEASLLGLSARQYEVLVLLAQGLPIKVICRHLGISMATTKGHIEAAYQRLGAHNRNEAVFIALARGAKLKISSATEPER